MGSFEVMNRTIDIAQSALARHTLAGYPADLLIEVPRSTCRSLEFHRAVEVIAVGRALATQALKHSRSTTTNLPLRPSRADQTPSSLATACASRRPC